MSKNFFRINAPSWLKLMIAFLLIGVLTNNVAVVKSTSLEGENNFLNFNTNLLAIPNVLQIQCSSEY